MPDGGVAGGGPPVDVVTLATLAGATGATGTGPYSAVIVNIWFVLVSKAMRTVSSCVPMVCFGTTQ
jgi:hypothetical protein